MKPNHKLGSRVCPASRCSAWLGVAVCICALGASVSAVIFFLGINELDRMTTAARLAGGTNANWSADTANKNHSTDDGKK